MADGGTLVILNIASLGLGTQAQVPDAVHHLEVAPLGCQETFTVSKRLIVGTHQNLEAAVLAGRFRRDLYERLAATIITVPPTPL